MLDLTDGNIVWNPSLFKLSRNCDVAKTTTFPEILSFFRCELITFTLVIICSWNIISNYIKKKKRNREKNLNDDTNEDTNNVIFNLLIRHELYIIYYYIKLLLIYVLLNILVWYLNIISYISYSFSILNLHKMK